MKKVLSVILSLVMVLSIAACATEPAATTAAAAEAATTAAQAAAEVTPENFDWHGTGKVVVYSGDASDITEKQVAAFTEMTGVQVEVVYGGDSELLARIEAEKDNPQGDVMKGATSDNLTRYTDYFDKYDIKSITPDEIGHTEPLTGEYWYTGAGGNLMVFLINKDLLAEADYPKTWKDLADPKYFGKIAFCDPTASSSAYIHLNCMMQLYGWEFVEEFYKNLDGKVLNSSSAVPKQTADGEYAVGVTIENNAVDYLKANANVVCIYPEDGTMRTQGGTVKIKNCKNPENAQLWLEASFSKAFAEITTSFNRRSSRVDTKPEGLAPFTEIKFMDYDYDMAADSEPILEKWNEIVINNG